MEEGERFFGLARKAPNWSERRNENLGLDIRFERDDWYFRACEVKESLAYASEKGIKVL